jgi:hypothetical protein
MKLCFVAIAVGGANGRKTARMAGKSLANPRARRTGRRETWRRWAFFARCAMMGQKKPAQCDVAARA